MIRKNRLINVKIKREHWKSVTYTCLYYSYFYWRFKMWISWSSISFKLNSEDKIYINNVRKIFDKQI